MPGLHLWYWCQYIEKVESPRHIMNLRPDAYLRTLLAASWSIQRLFLLLLGGKVTANVHCNSRISHIQVRGAGSPSERRGRPQRCLSSSRGGLSRWGAIQSKGRLRLFLLPGSLRSACSSAGQICISLRPIKAVFTSPIT